MIGWMLRAMIVAAALALAAELGERALVALHRPRRWAWVAALVTGAMLPVILWLLPATPSTRVPVEALSGLLAASAASTRVLPAPDAVWVRAIELAWLVGSGLFLAALGYTLLRLRAARRGWVAGELGGEPVLLSDRAGPAVVGLLRPAVVVPAWVAAAPVPERALVLAHERAHIRAGDPWLLAGAAVVNALLPWSPALWWAGRRLRAAVEADCDARVLASGADRVDYASLLVSTAERSVSAPGLRAALVESQSLVERRVRTMLLSVPRRPWRALGLFACAGLVAAIACDLGSSEVSPRATPTGAETRAGSAPTAAAARQDSIFEMKVPDAGALQRGYVYYRYSPRRDPGAAEPSGAPARRDTSFFEPDGPRPGGARVEGRGTMYYKRAEPSSRDAASGAERGTFRVLADQPPPLWIVDGRLSASSPLKTLSPDRIESVSVWKDAAVRQRFPQAAPGQAVVEIKTK